MAGVVKIGRRNLVQTAGNWDGLFKYCSSFSDISHNIALKVLKATLPESSELKLECVCQKLREQHPSEVVRATYLDKRVRESKLFMVSGEIYSICLIHQIRNVTLTVKS